MIKKLAIISLFALVAATAAAQSTSTVEFHVTDGGRATVKCTLDDIPYDPCTTIIYGRYKIGETEGTVKRISARRNRRRINLFRVPIMQPAVRKVEEENPIIYFVCQHICGEDVIVSNTAAGSYANCGASERTISPNGWLTLMKLRLRDSRSLIR